VDACQLSYETASDSLSSNSSGVNLDLLGVRGGTSWMRLL